MLDEQGSSGWRSATDSLSLRTLRAQGVTPAEIIAKFATESHMTAKIRHPSISPTAPAPASMPTSRARPCLALLREWLKDTV